MSKNHLANYKECNIYRNLQEANKTPIQLHRISTQHYKTNINTDDNNQIPILTAYQSQVQIPTNQQPLYSQILRQNQQSSDTAEYLNVVEYESWLN